MNTFYFDLLSVSSTYDLYVFIFKEKTNMIMENKDCGDPLVGVYLPLFLVDVSIGLAKGKNLKTTQLVTSFR